MKRLFKITLLAFVISINSVSKAQYFAWAKQIGGFFPDAVTSFAIAANGDIYLTGEFRGTVDFDPGPGINNLTAYGNTDMFILRLDASGNFIWVKQIGGLANEKPQAIALDLSSNVYTTGYIWDTTDFDPGPGIYNLPGGGFISKLDSTGTFVWAMQFGLPLSTEGVSIVADEFNTVYTTGIFNGTIDLDPGPGVVNLTSAGSDDVFVSKIDAAGNFVWAKQFSGITDEIGTAIAIDHVGNVYTSGYFRSDSTDFDPGPGVYYLNSLTSDYDIFISKLDSSGNFVWAKSMGGKYNDVCYSIALDNNGAVYTSGYFLDTADFDPGIGVYNLISGGFSDVFITKLDSNGNFIWAKQMSGPGAAATNCLIIDSAANIYTTGYMAGGFTDFDPGPGNFNLNPVGNSDAFISKLDSSGNFLWAGALSGNATSEIFTEQIAMGLNSEIYIAGGFRYIIDFDPGAGIFNMTPLGNYPTDGFILKLDAMTVSGENVEMRNLISIFPNPASDDVTITFHTLFRGSVEIKSILGKTIVYEEVFGLSDMRMDIKDISDGIYFVTVSDGAFSYTKKLIVQN
ncbi:MAG TPA: SBBP repeat-containing protein [Bacteroidia bacterium]|nr:SBBP repeat-containing protein [Bacteroidia bacterium]